MGFLCCGCVENKGPAVTQTSQINSHFVDEGADVELERHRQSSMPTKMVGPNVGVSIGSPQQIKNVALWVWN